MKRAGELLNIYDMQRACLADAARGDRGARLGLADTVMEEAFIRAEEFDDKPAAPIRCGVKEMAG